MTLARIEDHRGGSEMAAAEDMRDLETRFAMAVRQRELLSDYIKKQLQPGKHFYKVGAGKDSLTKEGAEIVLLAHAYKPAYDKTAGPDEPPQDNRPYQLTVKCRLLRNGQDGFGEGIGSASSHHTTRSGDYKPRQNDPGLCHNATLKMAQKSALIAATLNSTAASEFFTQDAEEGAATGDREATAPNKSEHYCERHKTNWFKKGKMRGYAHRIEGTDQWCNESEANVPVNPVIKEGQASTVTPPEGRPLTAGRIAFKEFADATYAMGWDDAARATYIKTQFGKGWRELNEAEWIDAAKRAKALQQQPAGVQDMNDDDDFAKL